MANFLVVLNGAKESYKLLLEATKPVSIGRNPDCNLPLIAEGVSREHCKIYSDNDTFWIEDTNSSNGTLVNGKKIKKTALSIGDRIQIGTIELQLQYHTYALPEGLEANSGDVDLGKLAKEASSIVYQKEQTSPTFNTKFASTNATRDIVLIHKIGKQVHQVSSIPALMPALLKLILDTFQVERGCIVVKSNKLQNPYVSYFLSQSIDKQSLSEAKFVLSESVLNAALEQGVGTVSADTFSDKRFLPGSSILNLNIHSILCVPIEGHDLILGSIYLDCLSANYSFTQEDLDLLTAIERQVGLSIDRTFLEQKLAASESHYRLLCESIIQNSKDVIYRRNTDQSFAIISPSIKDLLGVSSEDVQNNHKIWDDSVVAEDRVLVSNEREKIFSGETRSLEFRIMSKSSNEIWVEETCYPVYGADGNIVAIQGVLKNITEKKRLKERLVQAQKMEALGMLAGGVAHDLNNILGGLVGYPELILMQLPANSPLRKYLEGIKKSAERAADVVKDLLTIARKEHYTLKPLNLNELVDQYVHSLDLTRLTNRYPNVRVTTKLSENPLIVNGSFSHLYKVIMNLVSNAFESMPEGGTVTITTKHTSHESDPHLKKVSMEYAFHEGKSYAILQISDTGKGISSQDMKKLFEPFYTTKGNTHISGTGLGLCIVYGILQEHGGYIDVESSIDRGTDFTIYLLCTQPVPSQTSPAFAINTPKKGRLLVVDDVEIQRELAYDILTAMGYEVKTVASGEDAIEYLVGNSADLVILDMILEGGIDGLETYKRIAQHHPKQKVLIASGCVDEEKVKEAQRLGAGGYLLKPYTLEKLNMAIDNEMSKGMS